ncbi:hypothetical protein ACJMK2_031749 [Sinanodonta woodiana]|uniref:Uncharacterized protein n=1 Tax=Sinanodonta woodiana TaxID=1069815 RepID=A0ABD3X155_SINWO
MIVVYLQCGQFRTRLRRRFLRSKVIPQGTNGVAVSEKLQEPISHPTVTSSSSNTYEGQDRDESRTPEALNQVVEEFVEYEIKKIKALIQLKSDVIAEEMMARGASLAEINEAVRKEMKDGMATVDV